MARDDSRPWFAAAAVTCLVTALISLYSGNTVFTVLFVIVGCAALARLLFAARGTRRPWDT